MDEGNAKKHKCGSGQKPLFSELEDVICEWVAERRARGLIVRRADIQTFALKNALQFGIFPEDVKASKHWLDGFLQRHEFSLRRSTTLFTLEGADIIKHALTFKSFVDGIDFSKYSLSNMIAMDETAVFMGQGSQSIEGVRRQFIFPLPVMKVHDLHVFWQFVSMEVKLHF